MSSVQPSEGSPQPRKRGAEAAEILTRARSLVILVYELAAALPAGQEQVLADDLRRAAVAIVSNLANGQGRRSREEFRQQVSIAIRSAIELRILLLLSIDLELRTPDDIISVLAETERVTKALTGLADALAA